MIIVNINIQFFCQAEDWILVLVVTEVQTCALPICMRFYDIKYHYGRIPNHRASQKLSIGSFCMKLRALPHGGICMRFYDIKHYYGRIPRHSALQKIGRASCRERVYISVIAVSLKKNNLTFFSSFTLNLLLSL